MQTTTSAVMLSHYTNTHPSHQWRDFLGALAAEFESELDAAQLRALMVRIGLRFAERHPLPACTTLDALSDALNARWQAIDWGFVELVEAADHLRIRHCCAPLAAFGDGAATWAPGFLEGAYQHWLQALGAGALSVSLAHAAGPAELEFHLAR